MTYPRLHAAGRPRAAACFKQTRQRLAYVRQQEQQLPRLAPGFRQEMVKRTCERIRRETRLPLQAMRRLLHALFG